MWSASVSPFGMNRDRICNFGERVERSADGGGVWEDRRIFRVKHHDIRAFLDPLKIPASLKLPGWPFPSGRIRADTLLRPPCGLVMRLSNDCLFRWRVTLKFGSALSDLSFPPPLRNQG